MFNSGFEGEIVVEDVVKCVIIEDKEFLFCEYVKYIKGYFSEWVVVCILDKDENELVFGVINYLFDEFVLNELID